MGVEYRYEKKKTPRLLQDESKIKIVYIYIILFLRDKNNSPHLPRADENTT